VFLGVTDNSSTRFDDPLFNPPLSFSDDVEILGTTSPSTYTIAFGTPVTNPRLHLGSLASTLEFPGITLTKLSGEDSFVVVGSTVTGVVDDSPPRPNAHDSNGTIQLNGTFSSITFTAMHLTGVSGIGDGIHTQLGADEANLTSPVPEPGSVAIWIIGGVAIATRATWHRRRSRRAHR
jgi:hypothetical protein